MKPFVTSNDLADDTGALRRRADRDGYLFLRNVVNNDAVLEVRREIAATLQDVGWIDAGTDPDDAITSHPARVSRMVDFKPVYDAVQKLESFHTLAHDPILFHVTEALLGDDVLLQPSTIARFIFPTNLDETTPPHQDYVHIQGTPDVWSAWVPLGDCPPEMGGLSVLSGSHKSGIFPVRRSPGAGGLRSDTDAFGGEWVSSPFELGDVIFFHSHAVHKGLPNLSGNRLRLSVDYRYQRAADPVMNLVLGVHQGRLSWDEVYADWKSVEYKYHWREFDLTPVSKHPWPVAETTM
jgi:ectoine hydroxylase-related dioxygenase (phytanoyl-CoA dioxygenase family)